MYKIRPAARTFQTKIRLDSCHSHKNQEDFNLNKQTKKIPTKNVGFFDVLFFGIPIIKK